MVGLTSTEDRSEIAFFDVETTIPFRTGQGYAILEFGSILVCPKKLVELQIYSTLVKPANLNLITPRSVKCNGIKREDVASERSFADIAEDVYDILHGRIWAGHNILKFDCLRVREAFAAIGRDPPEPKGTIDSLVLLTQKFGRRAGDMKMATLAAYFGLGNQTHRSLDDVRMNFEVLKYCATVLFLESSLPDELIENLSTTPTTSSRRCRNIKTSPLQTTDGQQNGENSTTIPILSFVSPAEAQSDPFDMSRLKKEIAPEVLQSDILVAEEQNQPSEPIASEETSDQDGFVELDTISIPSIRAIHVPLYHGSQKEKIQLFLGDRPLRLHCPHQKVRFGISGKFLDNAGRRKLSFVIDLSPSLCNVLQECDSAAKTISIDSGSGSDWNPTVIQMKEFMNYPNARIHIPTELNGNVDWYAAEIHQRKLSGATSTQKLISSNPRVEELESSLNPGTVLDVFLSLEPYNYQQRAGIRLVARKLVIQESSLPDDLIKNSFTTPSTSSRRRRNIQTSPLQSPDGQQTGENSTTIPIPSFVSQVEAQSDPFDMSPLKRKIAPEVLQSDILMAEEQNQQYDPVAPEETIDQDGFVELDKIFIPSIRAVHVSFYDGSQKMKTQPFLGDRPLRLHCPRQKVRFGISGKFLDNAGRRKLSFVVDLSPSLCNVLQECDSVAKTISIDSGSGADWNPAVIQMKEFMNYPNARIHIPTELNGDVDRYATEIHQRELSGATSTQKLISSNPSVEELESLLNPGIVLDIFLSLEPYDYQQRAGIRLVARKLVIH